MHELAFLKYKIIVRCKCHFLICWNAQISKLNNSFVLTSRLLTNINEFLCLTYGIFWSLKKSGTHDGRYQFRMPQLDELFYCSKYYLYTNSDLFETQYIQLIRFYKKTEICQKIALFGNPWKRKRRSKMDDSNNNACMLIFLRYLSTFHHGITY